jgi:membrane-bound lytic murein transglycosylase D
MIESAYNPQAYSRSHAAGIWQFYPLGASWQNKTGGLTTVKCDEANSMPLLIILQKLHRQFAIEFSFGCL